MSADRLKELLRQRALLAEHGAWLDREIAAAQGASGPQPPVAALPAQPPPTSPSAVTAGLPAAPAAVPVPAAEVDALFDRLRSEEMGQGQVSKRGCWMVFATLMLISVLGVATLIFLRYR